MISKDSKSRRRGIVGLGVTASMSGWSTGQRIEIYLSQNEWRFCTAEEMILKSTLSLCRCAPKFLSACRWAKPAKIFDVLWQQLKAIQGVAPMFSVPACYFEGPPSNLAMVTASSGALQEPRNKTGRRGFPVYIPYSIWLPKALGG